MSEKKVKVEIVRGTVIDGERVIPEKGKKPPVREVSQSLARQLLYTHHARVPEEKPAKGRGSGGGEAE